MENESGPLPIPPLPIRIRAILNQRRRGPLRQREREDLRDGHLVEGVAGEDEGLWHLRRERGEAFQRLLRGDVLALQADGVRCLDGGQGDGEGFGERVGLAEGAWKG